MKNIKLYTTAGMCEVPKLFSHFRVGNNVGMCIAVTPWFVIMHVDSKHYNYNR